jgi:hypothetical protein
MINGAAGRVPGLGVGAVGTVGAGIRYQGVNHDAYASISRTSSTFNNKGSNDFCAGARFNF